MPLHGVCTRDDDKASLLYFDILDTLSSLSFDCCRPCNHYLATELVLMSLLLFLANRKMRSGARYIDAHECYAFIIIKCKRAIITLSLKRDTSVYP